MKAKAEQPKPDTDSEQSEVHSVSGPTVKDLEKPSKPFEISKPNGSNPWTAEDERKRKAAQAGDDDPKPWPRSALQVEDSVNTRWVVTVPDGTTAEELQDSRRWKTLSQFLCPGDRINIRWENWRKMFDAICLSGGRFGAAPTVLHIINEIDLPPLDPGQHRGWDEAYEISFSPNDGRWHAFRRSDDQRMTGDGADSRLDVEMLLANHPTNR